MSKTNKKSITKSSGSKTIKLSKSAKKTKSNLVKKKTQPADLSGLFKRLKDVLRLSDDHITGRDSIFAISQLVTLYLLESTNKIEHFGLPEWIKFSEIYKICNNDHKANKYKIKAGELLTQIFGELSNNEYTHHSYVMKPPYTKYKTFKVLVVEIHDFFSTMDQTAQIKLKENGDILGKEYEELLKTQLVGRDDGQYFTNRNAVKMIVEQVDPQISEKVYDPTCGTGGFIIYAYIHMRKQIKGKKIELTSDYKKLCEKTFYGCDLDDKIMEILHSNLILHDIKHNDHFKNCNTLTGNIVSNKYDVVLSNYPFGKKGGNIFPVLAEGELIESVKEYYGMKSTVLPLLFLKHTINILKIGGRAGIIVTSGELTNNGKDYDFYRKELVEENTLTKIIILPKGIFENAKGVSTAVICFTKGGTTTKVDFYNVPDIGCDKIELIRTVTKKQIKKSNYSLDPQVFEEAENIDYGDIPIMKLGDICEINYGTRITQKNNTNGEYPVYGGGGITFCTNDFNRWGKTLIVSRFGVSAVCVRIVDNKFWLNDSGMSLLVNSEAITQEYMTHIILQMMNKIFKCCRGTAQKNMDMDQFKSLKIPVPHIAIQNKIVEYIDPLFSQIDNYTQMMETEKMVMKSTMKALLFECPHELFKMEDICEFVTKNKKLQAKDGQSTGKYNFYTSSQSVTKFRDDYEFKENYIIIGRGGVPSIHYDNHFGISHDDIYVIKINNHVQKYIYYFMSTNIKILAKGFKGITIKHLSKDYLQSMQIPIPSVKDQNKIVQKMEEIESHILVLSNSIMSVKKNMEIIMNSYLKKNTKKKSKKSKAKSSSESSEDEPVKKSKKKSKAKSSSESSEEIPKKSKKKSKTKSSSESSEHGPVKKSKKKSKAKSSSESSEHGPVKKSKKKSKAKSSSESSDEPISKTKSSKKKIIDI